MTESVSKLPNLPRVKCLAKPPKNFSLKQYLDKVVIQSRKYDRCDSPKRQIFLYIRCHNPIMDNSKTIFLISQGKHML